MRWLQLKTYLAANCSTPVQYPTILTLKSSGMKKINKLILLTGFLLLIAACKKEDDPQAPDNAEAEPTPVGEILDYPVTQNIGPDGGTITSTDGKITMIFPAGALSSNTEISLQSITNYAPGGVGNAFRIGPGGTVLNSAVTLKYNYSDAEIAGSLPMFLKVAFQDTNQIWYDVKSYTVDTVNKSISVTTTKLFTYSSSGKEKRSSANRNFLDHATFLDLYITPRNAELRIKESKEFHVYAIEYHSADEGSGDEDALPSLPTPHEVGQNTVRNWSANGVINGDPQYGTIVANGTSSLYKAPDTKPSPAKNPVQLTAEIRLWYRDPVTGQDFNNLHITAPILIKDDNHDYLLRLSYLYETWAAAINFWKITDIATMDIEVRNGVVTIANIKNYDGIVTPGTKTSPYGDGTCTATWLEEDGWKGLLNVTEAEGLILGLTDPINNSLLLLTIKNTGTTTPKFKLICSGNDQVLSGGDDFGSQEYNYEFQLRDSTQRNSIDPNLIVTLESK